MGSINKKYFIIGIAILIIVVLVGVFAISKTSSKTIPDPTNQVSVDPPKSSQTLNKDFQFAIKDSSGQPIGNINYTIQSAELRDQIIVNGQKATAIAGREFLILNIKLVNTSTKDIQINTRDYIRLTINNGSDLFAPDIHNDPVSVQPTSTKFTRLGFPINNSDKNFKLQVGEISGSKTEVPLNNLNP